MNVMIQQILVFVSVALAVVYLLNRFGVLPKKRVSTTTKPCHQNDCGCH